MYNSDYMYAIERNDEYLAHYGVRGMRWGVRKAIESGNSARLSRQYAKASKKLAKLEKRASNSKKYARRAALMGAGAAAAGAVAGIGPTKIVGRGVGVANKVLGGNAAAKIGRLQSGSKVINALNGRTSAANAIYKSTAKANQVLGGNAATKIGRLDAGRNVVKGINNAGMRGAAKANQVLGGNAATKISRLNAGQNIANRTVSYNTLARLGAGAVGAGLAVGAARNAYKAATAQKKAQKFKSEMNKAFAGTKYASGGNRQGGKRRKRK